MELGFLLLALSTIVSTAAFSTCNPTTLSASASRYSISIYAAAYDCRIINIRPNSQYLSALYYLELSWSSSHFDVKGNMPFCKEDYLEVYLTRSSNSIGKFCSNNAGKPFTMYSRDGYARLFYSTNGYAFNSGFTFYYQLKSKIHDHLGGSLSSPTCNKNNNNRSSGVIYSSGWPFYYKAPYGSCSYKIYKSDGYQGAYVVFMDSNMYCTNKLRKDYVQLSGSNTSFNSGKAISPKFCSIHGLNAYITYSSYLKIELQRSIMLIYSCRGFLAGYIMFSAPTPLFKPSVLLLTNPLTRSYTTTVLINKPADEQYSKTFGETGIVLAVLLPVLFIIIIAVPVVIYNKNKERHISRTADQTYPLTSMPESSSHQITSQQTLQTAVPQTCATIAFSQPKNVYSTAPMQTAMRTTGSNYNEYPPTQYYSSAGIEPPQYSTMFNATHSSIPAEALQQSHASVVHRQQPAGALNHDLSAVTNNGGSAPPSIPLTDSPPQTPPPSYLDVINS